MRIFLCIWKGFIIFDIIINVAVAPAVLKNLKEKMRNMPIGNYLRRSRKRNS